MDSSSDDSFAWVKVTNRCSDNDSDSMTNANDENGHSDITSKKKKLKDHSETMDNRVPVTNKAKKRKIKQSTDTDSEEHKSPIKKKIKTEYNNKDDSKKKDRIVFEKSDDEHYLNIKVKTEELSTSEVSYSKPKKNKRKKHNNSDNLNESENFDDEYLNVCAKQEKSNNLDSTINHSAIVKKIKENKSKDLTNGFEEIDEDFLTARVKEEQHLSDTTVKLKKKQKSKLSVSSNFDSEHGIGNVDDYLNNQVKDEENTLSKHKSKKKKNRTSNNSDIHHNNNINENQTVDEISSQSIVDSPRKKKDNNESINMGLEADIVKKSKKSKKDKHHERNFTDHTIHENNTSLLENNRLDEKQETPIKLKQKKSRYSNNSITDDDDHVKTSDHIFKSPQINKKSNVKIANESNTKFNLNQESLVILENESSKHKPEVSISGSRSSRTFSQTVLNRKNSSREDSSDESSSINEAKPSKPVTEFPEVQKQYRKNIQKHTRNGSDSSSYENTTENKNKYSGPISESPQVKKQSIKNVPRRTNSSDENSFVEDKCPESTSSSPQEISKRSISKNHTSSEEENSSKPVTESPQVKRQSILKRTVSKSSDEDTDKNLSAAQSKIEASRRISERIMFEQDDSNNESQGKNDVSSKLKQFKTSHNLQPIVKKPSGNSIITDEDEIWIVKCPHDINVSTLKDSEFVLDKKCKFKMNGETYHGTVENDFGKMALSSFEQNGFVIRNLPLNGVVHVRKRIPKQHFQDNAMLVQSQNNFIPLPETKCRHPLFGANFKKAIKVPKHVAQYLKGDHNEALLSPEQDRKERKKNKKRLRESLKEEPVEDVVAEELRKKTKKPKHDTEVSARKAKKKQFNSSEVWDSEKAIEENLFNY